MSDFFLRLAERTLGQAATAQPEITSRFAAGPMVQRLSQMEVDASGDSLEPPLDSRSPIAAEPAVTTDALRHDDPQRAMRPPKRLPANESAAPPHSSGALPMGRPAAMIQDAAAFAAGDSGSTVARPHAGSDTPAAEQAFQSKTLPDMTAHVRSGVTVRADSLEKQADPEDSLRPASRRPKEPVQVRPGHDPGQPLSVPPLAPAPHALSSRRDSGTALQADVAARKRAALAPQAMGPLIGADNSLSTTTEPPKPPAPNLIRPISSASTVASASTAQPIPKVHPAETESDPANLGTTSGAPIIRVTIGRVEVRAIMPVKAERPLPTRSRPRLSLDEFLRQGDGRQR